MTTTEKIDKILKDREMSRRKLALQAGIPPSSLQSAMARGKNMTIEMLETIANTLGVSLQTLLPDDVIYEEIADKYFRSIKNWSHDRFFSQEDTETITMLFSELLLRYKALIERYQGAKILLIRFLDIAGESNCEMKKPKTKQEWISAFLSKCSTGEIDNLAETSYFTADDLINFFEFSNSDVSNSDNQLELLLRREMEKELNDIISWINATPFYFSHSLEKSLELNKNETAPGAANTEGGEGEIEQ